MATSRNTFYFFTMAGIYIHIPFCKQLCYYCDFYFSVSLQRKDEMLEALIKEIEIRAKENDPTFNEISTIYIGGGTPTVYAPEELGLLIEVIKANFSAKNIIEFTVEANPDDLTPNYLEGLRKIGVNRLSIGIQSFTDRDLKWMNRRHTAQEAISSVKLAQQAEFDNITIDLIYGIPAMSIEEWRYNLETALSLNVQHLSAYYLGIEDKTVFGNRKKRGLLTEVDEEESEKQFFLLRELTAKAGFEHYEISNFAKDAKYGIHNSNYWKQQPYIGVGPSAHSYNSEQRRWNFSNNLKYLERLNSNEAFYEYENLDVTTKYNEYILTSLRTTWGASSSYIHQTFGAYYLSHFEVCAKKLLKKGILKGDVENVKITPKYLFLLDKVVLSLFL